MHNRNQFNDQSSSKDIYKIAEQMHHSNPMHDEVQDIIGAYCQVEDIKYKKNRIGSVDNKTNATQAHNVNKATSQYSKKIKQTLREIHANKDKQKNLLIKPISQPTIHNSPLKKELDLWVEKGCKKLERVLLTVCRRAQKYTIHHLKMLMLQEETYQNSLITYWKLKKLFNWWRSDTIFNKIERERRNKEAKHNAEKTIQIANSFREFTILRRHLQFWKRFVKIQRRQKQLKRQQAIQELLTEQQNPRSEQQNSKNQQENAKTKENQQQIQRRQNHELQSKLRGFLDGLKEKVEDKRLKTIKQYTEESKKSEQASISSRQQLDENTITQQQLHEQDQQQLRQAQQMENPNQQRVVQQPPSANQRLDRKQLSNEELEQRRKQLADRAKTRKETLERKRREKETENQRIQNERKQIEKKIQGQQKKLKQEQYREFMRKKHEEEEWQRKQKELSEQAERFSRLRVMKYYGFIAWKSLRSTTLNNLQILLGKTEKAALRTNLDFVCSRILEQGTEVLEREYARMRVIHQRRIQKRVVGKFRLNKLEELQQKQELLLRHQVHSLNIYFREWFRLQPTLRLQRLQYQRPRMKKADQFYTLTLLGKGLEALKENKTEEQRTRNIEQHKNKMKEKLKGWTSEVDLDIEQFL